VENEAGRAAFRTALIEQLHGLTGVKPTLWQADTDEVQWGVKIPLPPPS
jgi:hypothetical protein